MAIGMMLRSATMDRGSASGMKIYLDGVGHGHQILNNALTGSIVSSGPLIIGNQAGYREQLRAQRLARSVFDFECGAIAGLYRAKFVSRFRTSGRCRYGARLRLRRGCRHGCTRPVVEWLFRDFVQFLHVDARAIGTQQVTYTPQAGFIGTDTFSYTETTASAPRPVKSPSR